MLTPARRTVYNARKRGTDSAAMYFQRTQNIAGVEVSRGRAQCVTAADRRGALGRTCVSKSLGHPTFFTGSA